MYIDSQIIEKQEQHNRRAHLKMTTKLYAKESALYYINYQWH